MGNIKIKSFKDFKENNDISKFNKEQIEMIKLGFKKGLSYEQIQVYAKSEFNYLQMDEIILGFENGLSIEQVLSYANPDLDIMQMKLIRICLEKGYNINQINKFLEFDSLDICEIIDEFKDVLTLEQILFYAKPEFMISQMIEIKLGFTHGLTKEQISVYAKLEFEADQMREIRLGFEQGLPMEQVLIYANPNFNNHIMSLIRDDLISKIPINLIKFYANPNPEYTDQIIIFKNQLVHFCYQSNKEFTENIINDNTLTDFDKDKMFYVYKYLVEQNYDVDIVISFLEEYKNLIMEIKFLNEWKCTKYLDLNYVYNKIFKEVSKFIDENIKSYINVVEKTLKSVFDNIKPIKDDKSNIRLKL